MGHFFIRHRQYNTAPITPIIHSSMSIRHPLIHQQCCHYHWGRILESLQQLSALYRRYPTHMWDIRPLPLRPETNSMQLCPHSHPQSQKRPLLAVSHSHRSHLIPPLPELPIRSKKANPYLVISRIKTTLSFNTLKAKLIILQCLSINRIKYPIRFPIRKLHPIRPSVRRQLIRAI